MEHISVGLERAALIALGVTAVLMLFAHRVPHGSGESKPTPDVIVRYWEKWAGAESAQLQEVVNDFNATVGREKHIQVQCLSMNGIDQKTLVAVAAGVPPDLAGLWDQQVAQFAALGVVQSLDELARSHGISQESYLPVFWRGCHYEGRLYALVSTAAPIALLYNRQLFHESGLELRAAGLDPQRAPATIAELDRYAQILTRRYADGRIERAGYLPLQSWYVPFTCYWFGGEIFDARTQHFTLTSPASIKAYRWIRQYYQQAGIESAQDFGSAYPLTVFNSPQSPFLSGVLAMQQDGPWAASAIARFRPPLDPSAASLGSGEDPRVAHLNDRGTTHLAWAFAPFPAASPAHEHVSFCTFDTLMIPSGAAHPREAFEFMAYLNRPEVSERLNRLHGTLPPLRSVSRAFLDQTENPYVGLFETLAASNDAHGVPPVPIWPEVWKSLTDTAQEVAYNGSDPAVLLAKVQVELQAKYDRFVKEHEPGRAKAPGDLSR